LLTSDLIRARRDKGVIVPRFLDAKTRERMRPVARALIAAFEKAPGATRADIDRQAAAVDVPARDRPIAFGLKKLCEDRAEFDVALGLDPERVRHELFTRAATAHRAIEAGKRFDRDPILDAVAKELSATREDVEAAMFADLSDNHRLVSFETLSPEALLDRYDVGLVQALLLRASELDVHVRSAPPAVVRKLFRAARFFGLLHTARRAGDGHHFRFDGPMSLFEGGQRYGIKLATFFPRLLEAPAFTAIATVQYGPSRTPLTLRVDETAGLRPSRSMDDGARPEIDALVKAFRSLESDWKVDLSDRVVALPGETVCVPDLVFSNQKTGEEVLFELFGFWSRDAVWKRIELVRKGFPGRILLAVGKQLRVSEAALEENDAGELVVFKSAISAKDVLARLEKPRTLR
jgi:predicted nuclease of restriction endonuclease-like RecB superfamily